MACSCSSAFRSSSITASHPPHDTHPDPAGGTGTGEEPFPWDSTDLLDGEKRANAWQGEFPQTDAASHEHRDGWPQTCPVAEYEPNGFGLYNMVGNVWEWTWGELEAAYHEPNNPSVQNPPKQPLRGGSHLGKLDNVAAGPVQ